MPNNYAEIGYQGENIWRPVTISIADLVARHPGGYAVLMITRPGEREAYIAENMEQTADSVIWTPTDYDTARPGVISAQAIYSVNGEQVGKTAVHKYTVNNSLSAGDGTPYSWEDWVNELVEAAAGVDESISEAEETLDTAAQAAQDAQSAAETAQEKAEEAQGKAEDAQEAAETAERNVNQTKAAIDQTKILIDEAKAAVDEAKEAVDDTAEEVEQNAEDAEANALKAEGYAVGTQNGTPATSGQPYFHDNAKYYKEQSESAKAEAVAAKNRAEQVVDGIEAAGTAQVQRVTQEGGTQVTAVQTKGEEVLESIPEDYTALTEEVSQLSNALQAYEGGTTGQVLRKKSNADNDVEWSDVGAPTDEQVQDAVDDYLDVHPEQTTTVVDGSLTEAKFTAQTLSALKNNYVTPEMFGAVGDGTTDDTQAIKDMFASNANQFYFPNVKYRVTGGINVSKSKCIIDFGGYTEFALARSYDARDFDYVISFKATGITTLGKLHVDANSSVNVGIWLSQCAGSNFDQLSCNYARVWGICTDSSNASLGSMVFNRLEATACGEKINAIGKCTSTDNMEITGIVSSRGLTDAAIRSMFDSKYGASRYILDDSGYPQDNDVACRVCWATRSGISLDTEDHTKGYFIVNYSKLYTGYNDGDAGRAIFIPFGGGVRLEPSASEGIYQIGYISTMRCPIGLALNMQYGGVVGRLVSQYDTICMSSNSMDAVIEYMYVEAVGTGFAYTEKNDRIYLIAPNDNTNVEVINPFVGQANIHFFQENEIPVQQQGGVSGYTSILRCSSYISNKKLNTVNVADGSTAWGKTINEYTQREYTVHARGFNGDNVTLDLLDLGAKRKNMFSPVTIYVRKYGSTGYYEPFSIKLSQKLIDAGYTINGGVNNRIQFSSDDYNKNMKVTIVLFNKTFFVMAEALTYVQDMSLST